MTQSTFFGLGIRRQRNTTVLDVYYPHIHVVDVLPESLASLPVGFSLLTDLSMDQRLALSNVYSEDLFHLPASAASAYANTDVGVFICTDTQTDIVSAEESYFKLQLLSQRLAIPHSLNLNGLFGVLQTLAWTNKGPVLPEDVERERIAGYAAQDPLQVTHVDKFPYLVNYHIPSGVRIASGSQVRLGAYLAEGSTVMPAGYVNFNAGTQGQAMIEGRVSAGVVVGDKSDVGGGASIMGTLSGGNNDVISIGQSCLLGANAGTGISLGDGCTIAAGLYVYAGMKISLYNANKEPVDLTNTVTEEGKNIVKAKALSGRSNLLFIQDSQTGVVTCMPNNKTIELNASLHQND